MRTASARSLPAEDDRPPAPRRLHLVQDAAWEESPPRQTEYAATRDDYAPTYAANGRRTVKITGQPVAPRRRSSATAARIEARPDRIAMWAVLLGLFLVLMAAATANAAVL